MDIAQFQKTENLQEATQQSKISHALVDEALENFDVLLSKINGHVFKYGYLYFLTSYLIYILGSAFSLTLICHTCDGHVNSSEWPISMFFKNLGSLATGRLGLATGSVSVLFLVIGAILLLLSFKTWRAYAPTTLRDLIENNRISVPDSNITTRYHEFIQSYHRALSRPVSYLPSAILLLYAIAYIALKGHTISTSPIASIYPRGIYLISFFVLSLLFFAIIKILLLYSIGITFFTTFITGRYLRKLLRDFQMKSDLTHLDKCGGLKILGNFCLRLALPLLVISLYFLGYAFGVLIESKNNTTEFINLWATLFICVLALLLVIWASIQPIWTIHIKMIHEGDIYQEKQSMELNALQKQMHELLHNNQIEEARKIKEKRELMETLNTTYPKWPFILKASIFSTLLLSSVTLLSPIINTLLPVLKK